MADIHPQLRDDCLVLGRFTLSHLLLMQDATYPWFILVPDRENISEIYQLSDDDQSQLLLESSFLAEFLMNVFKGDKMNIAALGNIVPQCHLHHVVRYHSDPAWPSPIWGKLPAKRYTESALNDVFLKLNELELLDFDYEKQYKY
ncbi:MAG: HIT domain-containing protein [Pseudomonadota bacterium]